MKKNRVDFDELEDAATTTTSDDVTVTITESAADADDAEAEKKKPELQDIIEALPNKKRQRKKDFVHPFFEQTSRKLGNINSKLAKLKQNLKAIQARKAGGKFLKEDESEEGGENAGGKKNKKKKNKKGGKKSEEEDFIEVPDDGDLPTEKLYGGEKGRRRIFHRLADSVACGSSTSMDDDDAGMMPPPPPKTQAGKREKPAAKKRKRDNDELTESAKARKKAAEPTTQEVDYSGDTLAVDARLQVDALQGQIFFLSLYSCHISQIYL